MSDATDRGITVTEMAAVDQPIDASRVTTAAFLGRALRGPVDTPVVIESFADFRRRFGGIWHRSSLGPAVRQYFDHGGQRLYVVRIANAARGAMICLPAHGGVLILRALEPGSTENIRAAIDYDGIDEREDRLFNLTVQRLSPDTGLIADQEIYRRISCRDGDDRFIVDALQGSAIVSPQTPLPRGRPAATIEPGAEWEAGYVGHAQRGSDGAPLTDYDLVGSAARGTGIFALNAVEDFDLLYLPPPARDLDTGPAAVLAAERYCSRRGAMLIMDPPAGWRSAREAINGIRQSGYTRAHILSYFPRMISRADDAKQPRVVGGAVAGLLAKLDRLRAPWEELDQVGFGFSRELGPAVRIDVDEAHQLVREGINVIAGRAVGCASLCGSVTLSRGGELEKEFSCLHVRRLCLGITNSIERATRWAVFETADPAVAKRIEAQVHAYMSALADAGAFANDDFVVHCDTGPHHHPLDLDRGVTILLMFQPTGVEEPLSLTLHQTVSGFRVATTAFAPVAAEVA